MLQKHKHLLNVGRKIGVACLLLGLVLLALRGYPYSGVSARAMTWFTIPILMIGVWSIVPSAEMPVLLVGLSFPIYVLHMFAYKILGDVARRISITVILPDTMDLYGYVFVCCFAIVFSIAAAFVIKSVLPKLAAIAFGGR